MPQIKESVENKKDALLSIKKPRKTRRIRELARLGHLAYNFYRGDQAAKELIVPYTTQYPRRSERAKKVDSVPKKRGRKRKIKPEDIPSESPETLNTQTFECFTCNTLFLCDEDVFFAHLDDCPGLGEFSDSFNYNDSTPTLTSLYISQTENIQPQKNSDPEEDVDVDHVAKPFGSPQFTAIDLNKYLKVQEINFSPETLELISLPSSISTNNLTPTNTLEAQKYSHSDNKSLISNLTIEKKDSIKENPDISFSEALDKINELEKYIVTLKDKINHLQTSSSKDHDNSSRCLICLDSFRDPLVSTECWHVHCRECWFHTLAVKKLCPECQRITFPEELRRIYL